MVVSLDRLGRATKPWALSHTATVPSFAIRWVSRDTFRLADFLWMIPVRAARMSAGSAATRAAWAAALLPLEIASSTLRNDERMRVRRALLTSVRRAILRVAFLADLVLAIGCPWRSWCPWSGVGDRRLRRFCTNTVRRR